MKKSILLTLMLCGILNANCTRDDAKEIVTCDTGLTWQDNSVVKTNKLNWKEAIFYCKNLNFAGYSDWRLPSINELKSIVDENKYSPAINNGFVNADSKQYWSSTTYASDSGFAWNVYFYDGYDYWSSKPLSVLVRCVR